MIGQSSTTLVSPLTNCAATRKAVGSSLIGQSFTDTDGNPLPQYFQGRPSAAGDGYDPMATSASNGSSSPAPVWPSSRAMV